MTETPRYDNLPVGITEEEITNSVLKNLKNFAAVHQKDFNRIMAQVQELIGVGHPIPPYQRWKKLHQLADNLGKLLDPYVPCKSGCSHCCHMNVTTNRWDAELIGKHIGIPPVKVDGKSIDELIKIVQEVDLLEYCGVPCPFLEKGKCSIYPVRPLACKAFFNVSDFPILCDVISGRWDVPSINLSPIWLAEGGFLYEEKIFPADIRVFFPEGRKSPVVI